MSFKSILKGLPECELLRVLYEKACEKNETDFDCFGVLEQYRKTVAGEVRQINQLFDEYTPHEEEHHLKPLFKLADEMLGRERFEAMECGELLVLAVALYGHDWGMAVSEPEKEYICTGKVREGHKREDFAVLGDEKKHLRKFARDYYLEMDESGWLKELPPKEIWREYVRLTHAYRSGEKIRRYFQEINGSVAEAAGWVCIGHGLGFEELQNPERYPGRQSVLGKPANGRALAVFLRLIDLLDLSENRTPYVIWKFVAPKNPRSKMEWAKHRALREVTFPKYQEGRVIRVDGTTDDPEVYAALEDLRVYVEEQLRGCNDTLAQIPGEPYTLDLYHVDWQVRVRGFEKVSIRFQFDRDRMFEILGEEIYQDDPYVFLRELLQNSIDAIRLRREVLRQRARVDPKDFGEIRVTVNHREKGDTEIIWQDDGIGMDEHVVRNYLAVGGRSYYRSKEFEAEGIEIDPISRFGIGILSCFIVADQVEIDTCKDPNLPPASDPLRILIPDMRRQFRVEKRHEDAPTIGTTVRVLVDGRKLPKGEEDAPPKSLDVTAYLCAVAGFVEFPVIVTEGERKTIVLHPKQDPEAARTRWGDDFDVRQLELSYHWTEAIRPQDVAAARKWFQEKRLDLASDLNLKGYEGVLSYLYPLRDDIDIKSEGGYSIDVIVRGEDVRPDEQIRTPERGPHRDYWEPSGLCRSSRVSRSHVVYRDGILLAGAKPPSAFRDPYGMTLPEPRLVVNLPKSGAPKVDLARTELVGQPQPWDRPILDAHVRRFVDSKLEELLKADPAERYYRLGRLIAFDKVTEESLGSVFPVQRWPVAFLDRKGVVRVVEWQQVAKDPINLFPEPVPFELSRLCDARWVSSKEYKGILTRWAGDRCIVRDIPGDTMGFQPSASTKAASELWRIPAETTHRFSAIRFLTAPWGSSPPLAQPVWSPVAPSEAPLDRKDVLQKAIDDPALLTVVERTSLTDMFSGWLRKFPPCIEFHEPFHGCLAYGELFLNIGHPIVKAVLQFAAAWRQSDALDTHTREVRGRMEDAVKSFCLGLYRLDILHATLPHMWHLAGQLRLFDVGEVADIRVCEDLFVPGSIRGSWVDLRDRWVLGRGVRSFGQTLR